MKTIQLSENSTLKYCQNFYPVSKEEYKKLMDMCPEHRHQIKIYGRYIEVPRYQQAYGEEYAFSGTVSPAVKMPPLIQKIRDKIQKIYPDYEFNNCLGNWYMKGDHYISFHSDDESQIIKGTPIVGVSFCTGLPRKLRIKNKETKQTVIEVLTYHGSLYAMEGDFQKEFLHGIPKQKNSGPRLSLTFRCFYKN